MSDRTVLYVSGHAEDAVQEQMRQAQQLCTEQGYTVAAVARETPGSTDAWEDAHRMVREGEADRIVVASGAHLPDLLESATGGIPGGHPHRRGAHRRVRMLWRGAGA